MDTTPCGDYLGRGCVEVLILQFALSSSIYSEGKVRSELLYIEVIYTCSDLLIGCEADADLAVWELGVSHDIAYSLHDLSHTCLVVSS